MAFEKEEIPEGWIKTNVGQLYDIIGGGTPSTTIEKYWKGGIPWISSADIYDLYDIRPRRSITVEAVKNSATNLVPSESIIVVTRVGLGKIAYTKTPICFSQDSQALVGDNSIIDPHYALYYLFKAVQIFKHSNQGTTISGVTKKQLSELSFLLPSFNEQKRIVSKIESIFSQIDAAKQQLERLALQMTSASGSLAQLKSSVLKQAFDGKLTSQDSDNKYDASKWNVAKLEDITLFSKNGFTGRPNKNNRGIPRLGIETITNSNSVFINTSKCKFIDIPSHRLDNYLVQKNDLFFCRQNGNKNYVGKCCIFKDNIRDTIFSDSLILFRVDCDKIYLNYLAYFVNSASGRNQIERYCSTTAGNYSINGTNLKKILIKFPPITEQKKIVAKLESIFDKIDAKQKKLAEMELQLKSIPDSVDALKRSILKLAFEGKLVPQDPNDEPASILLERIKSQQSKRASNT